MNTAATTKIWTTLGLALAYFSLAAWTSSQGADFGIPGLALKDYKGFPATIFGILVGVVNVVFLVYVGRHFMRSVVGQVWSMRIPIAFSLDIDCASTIGKAYQAFFLVAFLVVPLCAQIHFIAKFWRGCLRLAGGCFSLYSPLILFTNDYQYYNVTFFPFYEPVFLTLLSCASISLLFYYLICIFFIKRQDKVAEHANKGDFI